MSARVYGPLDGDLLERFASWEARVARPGLPQDGYVVRRGPSGDTVRTHPGERVVREYRSRAVVLGARADGPALVAAVSPDESARMEIVRPGGDPVPVVGARFRGEQATWRDERTAVVTAESRAVVGVVDAAGGHWRPLGIPAGRRLSVSPAGILTLRPDGVRALFSLSGHPLGEVPADTISVVAETPEAPLVVVRRSGIDLHRRGGLSAAPVRWRAPGTVWGASVGERGVVVLTVEHGRHVLTLVDPSGRDRERRAVGGDPGEDICSVGALSSSRGEVHVLVEGFATPPVAQRFPFATVPSTPGLCTRMLTAGTEDGAQVQIVVTAPAGDPRPRPLLLDVYGGFGVPSLPRFEPTTAAWTSCGGAVALAQVRGGGEHDERWRRAGRGTGKLRTVDDLATAARALTAAGVSSPDGTVLTGGSLGGVVAAACALRHPDVAAGVVATAAPLDLARLRENPLGHRWVAEFGDPDDDGAAVARYDPTALAGAHRPRPGAAPAFLALGLADDTRVAPGQAARFVEILRGAGADASHIRIDRAGHGANTPDALRELGIAFLAFARRVVSRPPRSTP
ncbi:prolyl oligopeptidase family serine peptidase [Rhodococcus triatomae]|uniref:prolyl oligopeptidase family serine peptidase n=1 Tax=Rhodococcus triatomae TaxID=300028 RepID=UPI0009332F88|nr:prolyl oligopeptidase family serine peptidase [Rhodococcus triatomae]QNG19824.1 S9 family peptidase [Rhodococcus triatomae]